MNECYKCSHRREIPGSAHSRCAHPKVPDFGPLAEIASLIGGGPQLRVKDLHVIGNGHGKKMGWFMWPLNFDPVWLESCDGFEEKQP